MVLDSGFAGGFVFGLLAGAHCAGMCGGFSLHLSRASERASVLARQGLYVFGKAFAYAFLGALFGALGSGLSRSGLLPESQRGIAYVTGSAILLFGLGMLGVRLPLPAARRLNAFEWGFVRSLYGHFFAQPGRASSFLLGVATGFLPCPMTLAALAAAAAEKTSSAHASH